MDVFCDWCGMRYDPRDEDVFPLDGAWFCADESACRERKAVISLEAETTGHPYQAPGSIWPLARKAARRD